MQIIIDFFIDYGFNFGIEFPLLIGNAVNFGLVRVDYFEIEGWIKDASNAILFVIYFGRYAQIFLFYENGVILFIEVQDRDWFVSTVFLV